MINISKNAQKHFSLLLSKEPIGTQIRVFITNPGTLYAECGLSYCLESEIEKTDLQIKYDQFYIYVNKSLLPFLKNSEIDLIVDKLGSQLTLKAPYSRNNLLNQASSLEEKVQRFLSIEINPQLLIHGGKVDLIKIDSHGVAIIQFSGGCNGCSMIAVTLKETVEKKIISHFPEIKKVCDRTEHLRGQHSFY